MITLVTLLLLPLELLTSTADRDLRTKRSLYKIMKAHEQKDQIKFLKTWAG